MNQRKSLLTILFAGAAAWGLPAPVIADALPAGAAALERGMPKGTLHVTDPGPMLFASADTARSALGGEAPSGGTLAELSSARNPPSPARLSAHEAGSRRGMAAPPAPAFGGAPSGTLVLLCGLVVVAYVARRRMG
jgi:hypothetical protein